MSAFFNYLKYFNFILYDPKCVRYSTCAVRKWICVVISHCAYGFILSFLKGTSCLSCRLQRAVNIFGFAYIASTEIVDSVVFLFVALCGIVRSKGYFDVSFLEYLRRYFISYTKSVKAMNFLFCYFLHSVLLLCRIFIA
jgi:hypothetical protein